MTPSDRQALEEAEKRHLWHPFTQMKAWCAADHHPVILDRGEGAHLWDIEGNKYIDGNSSIWTNCHGHNHPKINQAIADQLQKVAHVSFLGSTNAPAIQLAERLVRLFPPNTLSRVFYSDDGSTAVEVAIKMALQYWQLANQPERKNFLSFQGAYHGDTTGASSLGNIGTFHDRYHALHFPVRHVAGMEELRALDSQTLRGIAAIIIEPLIQGAAGMRLWPHGMLKELRKWCDDTGTLLIFDEVLTGFGRTGTLFACQQEGVLPDFLALAKGITGGYLPLAVTLTTEAIFEAFLGEYDELKTFFYGHSYCGNPLGCAAALASLQIFEDDNMLEKLQGKIALMQKLLNALSVHPHVGEIRQCGFMAGIDIVKEKAMPFPWQEQTGNRVCVAARKHGLLTRPILDTVVLMPPYCIRDEDLEHAIQAIHRAISEVCGEN
ncbi:MAG: adenosylmethionine--8-amino-7-oxononanoate transaminase [Chthoniobacterales bacterium]